MNPTWNIGETRQLIERLYGSEQLELVRGSLDGMISRRDHANVHWHNTRNVLNRFARQAETKPLFVVALGASTKERDRYYVNLVKAQAYVIALVQSLHSIPDICAHAVYYGLALNNGASPLKERDIAAARVKDKLSAPDVTNLKSIYSSLFEGGEFEHLAAISNHSKHRSVVKPSLNEDYTGTKDKVRLEFPAFEHNGKPFPATPVREFTEREYNRIARSIVDIGIQLNHVLQARAAAFPQGT